MHKITDHSQHTHDHPHKQGHGHTHDAAHHVLFIAIILTLGFAVIEALVGWLAQSLALLSDAGHMASDSLSLLVAAVAAWLSTKPPSKKHSYGLGRAEVMGAWISSFFMLILCVVILVEAIRRIQTPTTVNSLPVIFIGALGMVVNMLIAWLLSRKEKNLNIRAAMLHVFSDLLGSAAALIAGVVIYFTHWQPIDPLLSIVISLLILFSSIRLLYDSLQVLMEAVPSHIDTSHMRLRMKAQPSVYNVHDLHVWNLSSGNVVLSAHIDIESLDKWPHTYHHLQQVLRDEFQIDHITLQPELISHPLSFHPPKNQRTQHE